MSASSYVFDSDQLDAAARQFVEQGPKDTRALRQAEVDGARNFLLSDAARKLRIEHRPLGSTAGLSPEGRYRG